MRWFPSKVTVDQSFPRINSFTSILKEVWQELHLATFGWKQLFLCNCSGCNF